VLRGVHENQAAGVVAGKYAAEQKDNSPSQKQDDSQEGADDRLKGWLQRHPGRRVFFLFERYQKTHIQDQLPPEARGSFRVVNELNDKIWLAQADL